MGGSVGNRSARTGWNLAEIGRSMLRPYTKRRGIGVIRGRGGFENADLRVANRIGVVIDVYLFDVSFAFLEVQMLHVELRAAMHVDGFLVHAGERAGKIHFADDVGRASDIDNHKIIAGDGAQAYGVRGIGFVGPVIILSRAMQEAGLCKPRAEIGKIYVAEAFFGRY